MKPCGILHFSLRIPLVGISLLLSSVLMADGGYYTVIDAQGRVVNLPKESSPESPPGDDTEYLSEQQIEKKIEQYDQENPSFYVWTDAEGRVYTETYDAEAEQAAAAEVENDAGAIIGWDPILAPPFRVSEKVTTGPCCGAFAEEFQLVPEPFKSVQLFDPVRYRSFPTSTGNHRAWYFEVPEVEGDLQRFLMLRLRGAPVSVDLIALNSDYQPLYYSTSIPLDDHPETWHSVGYQEGKILIEDDAVTAFVLYMDMQPAEDMSLEIRWADGQSPF